MKRVLTAAVVILAALQVQAQEPGPHEMRKRGMHKRGGMEFRQLELTAGQKAGFKKQHDEFRKQMEELKKNENITVKEWKTRKEALMKKHRESMQNILTTEQKAKLEKQRADRMAMHEVDAKARLEKMKIQLGLSNEQAAKLEKQRSEMKTQMKALHDNQQLNQEQKREKMKELMKKQKETMKGVLTPEQQKKLDEMKPGHEGKGGPGGHHHGGKSQRGHKEAGKQPV